MPGSLFSLDVPSREHFYDTMTVHESQDKRKFQSSITPGRTPGQLKNIRQLPDKISGELPIPKGLANAPIVWIRIE